GPGGLRCLEAGRPALLRLGHAALPARHGVDAADRAGRGDRARARVAAETRGTPRTPSARGAGGRVMGAQPTMRAAVIAGPRMTRVERIERPEPGPGEVRIRVEGCGVCGSSAPVWEGRPWFEYPQAAGAPGHEAWGR